MNKSLLICVLAVTLLVSVAIVLAAVSNFALYTPANDSFIQYNYANLKFSVNDSDGDAMTVRIFGDNSTTNLNSNESLLYEDVSVADKTILTYNWTAPVINRTSSTLALFHFDQQSSQFGETATTAFDFSRTSHNATCTVCPTFMRTGGKFAGAYSFDGTNDFWSIADNSFKTNTDATIEAWIWSNDTSSPGTIFSVKGHLTTSARDIFLMYLYQGRLAAGLKIGNTYNWLGTGDTSLSNQTWYYVAVTVNSTGNYFFVNGVQQQVTYSFGGATSNTFFDDLSQGLTHRYYLGKAYWNGADQQLFAGTIDEFAYHSPALSGSELLEHTQLSEGTWFWQVSLNDGTTENRTTTGIYNFTTNYFEDWTRTPTLFGTVSGTVNTNITLGILNIIDLGGGQNVDVNISLSSSYAGTYYNQTLPYNITSTDPADNTTSIEVNFSAPLGAGSTDVTITATALNALTLSALSPTSLISTGTVIYTTAADPALSITISQPTSGESYVRGSTSAQDVNLTLDIENVGAAQANDVQVWFTLPDAGWTVASGSQTANVGTLTVGETYQHSLLINIGSTATAGSRTISSDASASYTNGTSLYNNLITEDSVTVTVTSPVTISSPPSGSDSTSQGSPIGGSSLDTKAVSTVESTEIVRGESDSFTVSVENIYEGTILTGLSLQLLGFKDKYSAINPSVLPDLKYGEVGVFKVDLAPPAYATEEAQMLTAVITGEATGKYSWKIFDERKITLFTVSMAAEKANSLLLKAAKAIAEVQSLGIVSGFFTEVASEITGSSVLGAGVSITGNSISVIDDTESELIRANITTDSVFGELYLKAEAAYKDKNYEEVQTITNRIILLKDSAVESKDIINYLDKNLPSAERWGRDLSMVREQLELARTLFTEEDYEGSVKQARAAKLTYMLETRAFELVPFLKQYWWAVLITLSILSIAGFVLQRRIRLLIIAYRLEDLEKEESTLSELKREAQRKRYSTNELSAYPYHRAMAQYEGRLTKIRQIRANLRRKRVAILQKSKEIEALENEKEEVIDMIKVAQKNYFEAGKISRSKYLDEVESDQSRLAEIEEEKATMEIKLAKEEGTFWYKIKKKWYDFQSRSVKRKFERKVRNNQRRNGR